MYWPTTYSALQNFSRLLDDVNRAWGLENGASNGYPRVNAYANEEGMLLTMEVPGVDPAQLDVQVQANKLRITGELPAHQATEGESFHRSERRTGKFTRELTLPYRVDPGSIRAETRRGVLAITLPKPEEEKPRQIVVHAE